MSPTSSPDFDFVLEIGLFWKSVCFGNRKSSDHHSSLLANDKCQSCITASMDYSADPDTSLACGLSCNHLWTVSRRSGPSRMSKAP